MATDAILYNTVNMRETDNRDLNCAISGRPVKPGRNMLFLHRLTFSMLKVLHGLPSCSLAPEAPWPPEP